MKKSEQISFFILYQSGNDHGLIRYFRFSEMQHSYDVMIFFQQAMNVMVVPICMKGLPYNILSKGLTRVVRLCIFTIKVL